MNLITKFQQSSAFCPLSSITFAVFVVTILPKVV